MKSLKDLIENIEVEKLNREQLLELQDKLIDRLSKDMNSEEYTALYLLLFIEHDLIVLEYNLKGVLRWK